MNIRSDTPEMLVNALGRENGRGRNERRRRIIYGE
jgi:hypothetical protein